MVRNKCYKIVFLCLLSASLGSCRISKVYTSASYGGLKSYTEKPVYKGKNESANYLSGGLKIASHSQVDVPADEVIAGNFSIHRATTLERFKIYYGLGSTFGKYKFNSDYTDLADNTIYVTQGEELDYHNINLKLGFNFTKTWDKVEFNMVGLEFIYLNESGSYIDKLKTIPESDRVAIIDQRSLLAFNINSEAIIKINNNNNVGIGIFVGGTLLADRERANDSKIGAGFYNGFHAKYTHRRFTISLVYEHGKYFIQSTSFGLTYRFLDK